MNKKAAKSIITRALKREANKEDYVQFNPVPRIEYLHKSQLLNIVHAMNEGM